MDQELIRKAAEAMWKAFQRTLDIEDSRQMPFDHVGRDEQQNYLRNAEAALTVFYEHTHAQAREHRPPNCPDCGAVMRPAGELNPGSFVCPKCGRTQWIST